MPHRHVQKRLRTRLRTKFKDYKCTAPRLSDAGKLTEKKINSMQNYYGKSIRSNSNKIYTITKAETILWYCTEFSNNYN